MSLEYAFKPFEDPKAGMEADKKAIEFAERLASENFDEVLGALKTNKYVLALGDREVVNTRIQYKEQELTSALSRIVFAVRDLNTVLVAEKFRGRKLGEDLSYDEAYSYIKEIRHFDPKTRLILAQRKFYEYFNKTAGEERVAYIYRAARASFRLGKIKLATDLLRNVISKTRIPLAYPLGEALAFIYSYLERPEDEIRALERTLELMPLRTRARHRLAYLYEKVGKPEHAERARLLARVGRGLSAAAFMAYEAFFGPDKDEVKLELNDRLKYLFSLIEIITEPERFSGMRGLTGPQDKIFMALRGIFVGAPVV